VNVQRFRPTWLILSFLFGLAAAPVAAAASGPAPQSFRVAVSGDGPPMILIPGMASSGETWDTTVARYRDRYTCHVLTLAGFAGVPPIDTPLLAAVREELAAYVRENRLDRPVIVGHSLGGTLALAMAIDHPDLVGSVVVVDMLPFLAGAQMQVESAADAQPAIAAMRAYFSTMTRAQYDQYVSTGTATKFMVANDADHDRLKRWSLASDPATVGSAMADLWALDLREEIARITAPTLVLGTWRGLHEQLQQYGTNLSRADVVATFAAQFARLQRLHFVLSETARHFIMFDTPDWFFDQLDRFLAHPTEATADRGLPRD
jgi:pimeloyl-ACP methyl ester carboxylesterase